MSKKTYIIIGITLAAVIVLFMVWGHGAKAGADNAPAPDASVDAYNKAVDQYNTGVDSPEKFDGNGGGDIPPAPSPEAQNPAANGGGSVLGQWGMANGQPV